jgi:hypothetical protein
VPDRTVINGDSRSLACAAGMLEADHQFRRVNGRLHLPKLRTTLEVHFTRNVSTNCDDETVNAV